MTPLGFWTIRSSLTEGVFWIRMSKNPLLLALLGVLSLLACQIFQSLHRMYHKLGGNSVLVWRCNGNALCLPQSKFDTKPYNEGVSWMRVCLYGFGGAVAVALPCFVTCVNVPLNERYLILAFNCSNLLSLSLSLEVGRCRCRCWLCCCFSAWRATCWKRCSSGDSFRATCKPQTN